MCPRCDAPAQTGDACERCALPLRRCGQCRGVAGPFHRFCGFCGYELVLGHRGDHGARGWLVGTLLGGLGVLAGLALLYSVGVILR